MTIRRNGIPVQRPSEKWGRGSNPVPIKPQTHGLLAYRTVEITNNETHPRSRSFGGRLRRSRRRGAFHGQDRAGHHPARKPRGFHVQGRRGFRRVRRAFSGITHKAAGARSGRVE